MNHRVVCVLKGGGDFEAHHVYALREGCRRWLPEHEFVCLTDLPVKGSTRRLQNRWNGWWAKMELFREFDDGVPTLYLDLDTVLLGDCRELFSVLPPNSFAILRDLQRGRNEPKAMGSGIMYWSRPVGWIYNLFKERTAKGFRGDQDFLEAVFTENGEEAIYLQDVFPGIVSYKLEVMPKCGSRPDHRMVCFHGQPRPWEQDIVPYPKFPDLVLREGWVVPRYDSEALRAILRELPGVGKVLKHLRERKRTVIQAGGFVGIWPTAFAEHFQRCLTFEPDPTNFRALEINTGDFPNIVATQAALGAAERDGCSINPRSGNCGAHSLNLEESGTIKITTIDRLGISDCDLIQLDVEGFEYEALLGGERTIRECRPVIMIELNGLGDRYGHTNADTENLLMSWGYERTENWMRDVIFTFQGEPSKTHGSVCPIAKDATCVLVGNGPSATKVKLGNVIDSFEEVVRFNQFMIGGFEECIGTKTTLYATFGRGTTPGDESQRPKRILLVHEGGSPAWEAESIWRIPSSFYWETVKSRNEKENTQRKIIPSTGYLVAAWLLHQGVQRLHLIGFDHFSRVRDSRHHYWVSQAYVPPPEHDGDFEREQFRKWEDEGRVFYLG